MMKSREAIESSIKVKQNILEDKRLLDTIEKVAEVCIACLNDGGKVLFCGNGGSAADAQHLASELSGRFYYDREPLFSEALHVNTSYLTAVANDYSYDEIYARMVKSKGRKGDVRAFQEASSRNMINVALTGESGGKMKAFADYLINVPSKDTPRIQEAHILIGHIICEIIERRIFPKDE